MAQKAVSSITFRPTVEATNTSETSVNFYESERRSILEDCVQFHISKPYLYNI